MQNGNFIFHKKISPYHFKHFFRANFEIEFVKNVLFAHFQKNISSTQMFN